jgi:flagellar motor switch/type III secretory pathway protein FliN
MTVQDLLALEEDEVLAFDYPVDRPVDLLLNGTNKFQGDIINTGRKRSFRIRRVLSPEESSLTVVPS